MKCSACYIKCNVIDIWIFYRARQENTEAIPPTNDFWCKYILTVLEVSRSRNFFLYNLKNVYDLNWTFEYIPERVSVTPKFL